jgi:hypothetical protein
LLLPCTYVVVCVCVPPTHTWCTVYRWSLLATGVNVHTSVKLTGRVMMLTSLSYVILGAPRGAVCVSKCRTRVRVVEEGAVGTTGLGGHQAQACVQLCASFLDAVFGLGFWVCAWRHLGPVCSTSTTV